MLISVIIPVFNAAGTLKKCVNSVLSDFDDLEIILIDDGSDDGSSAICDEFALEFASKFKVAHQENRGVSAARNVGLDLARGEFIAFVDSDDYVRRGYFAGLLAQISGCDAIIASIAPSNRDNFELSGAGAVEFLLLDKAHKFGWYVANKLFARDLIAQIRFGEDEFVMEDFSFFSKVLLNARSVAFGRGGLYAYEPSSDSIMRSKYCAKFRSILAVQDSFLRVARAANLTEFACFFITQSTLFLIYKARDAREFKDVAEFGARLREFSGRIVLCPLIDFRLKVTALAHAFLGFALIWRAKLRGLA